MLIELVILFNNIKGEGRLSIHSTVCKLKIEVDSSHNWVLRGAKNVAETSVKLQLKSLHYIMLSFNLEVQIDKGLSVIKVYLLHNSVFMGTTKCTKNKCETTVEATLCYNSIYRLKLTKAFYQYKN
jgi:hypothetical protein